MKKSHVELLKEHGISPSLTRIEVYNYLDYNRVHPNVDMIYKKLNKKLPTLSKTTVYNVLKLFVETGIVKEVTVGSQEARYEVILEEHSHFKCEVCGKLYDIPLVKTEHNFSGLEGFSVNEEVVLLKGICPSCQQKH